MKDISKYVDKTLSIFLMILMGAMVLTVTWQVITRFILPNPSSFTEELAQFQLVWIGVLGASYALRKKAHLGIDIIMHKVSLAGTKVIHVIVHICIILFAFFIMIIGGVRLVSLTFILKQISASMGIPMGYIYMVIPISGLLMIYYSILAIQEIRRPDFMVDSVEIHKGGDV